MAPAGKLPSIPAMARVNMMRWSGRSQDLLVRAVADQTFVADMLSRGIPESQLRLWIAKEEVPISFRGRMRGWVEDWAHANPESAAGRRL